MQRIFHGAADLDEPARSRFIQDACAGDEALLADVQAMLADDAGGLPLLEGGLPDVARAVLSTDTSTSPLPATIGPYRLVSLVGEGGMGVVYRAERDDINSVAAIKVLRHAWLSPARRERFMAEQRMLAQLTHPAIARLYDADVLPDGTPWFAMEYVEGQTLTDYCNARSLSIPGRLALFRAACVAVQHAHGHLIIHRDLKPSNILVRPDGELKLLDFGISKQLEPESPADPTITALRLMTPAYAAPEQIRGGPTGVYTDVYALGVILYELLAGRRPFDLSMRTAGDAAAIVAEAEAVRPSLVAGRLPASRAAWADLNVLSLTALRKEPERRYATVEALVRDIDHYLAGEPLEARPDSISYRGGKFVRRHWRGLAAGAATVALLVALTVYYTAGLAAARTSAEAEAARSLRIQQFMLNLFDGGDATAGPADDLRVVTLIERGVQQARALDTDPVVQADLYQTLGGLSRKLGNFSQAETLLTTALDRRRALFGRANPLSAESLIDLGLLHVDLARLDDAERLVREGLDATTKAGGAPIALARATAALGQVLEARGAYDEAIRVNTEAVRLFTAAGDTSAGLYDALGQLADSHYYAGHYDVADEINGRVLAANRRMYGDHHPRVTDVLVNLGASQTDRGRYAEAEAFYRQALASVRTFSGPNHFRTAAGMTMLGRVLVYQKKFDEGAPLLREALDIQVRIHGPTHPRVASAANDLGSAALQQGRLDEAEAYFQRMLDIYAAVYKHEHYLVGIATSNLASVLAARDQYARAERLYREAIGIYERTLSPNHLNTGIGRVKLGRTLLRQKRYKEAEQQLLAGYEILRTQANPSVSWMTSARQDLAAAYDALGDTAKAATYR